MKYFELGKGKFEYLLNTENVKDEVLIVANHFKYNCRRCFLCNGSQTTGVKNVVFFVNIYVRIYLRMNVCNVHINFDKMSDL